MENNTISNRVKSIQESIDLALIKSKRNSNDLKVMVVTKSANLQQIIEVRKAGFDLFGENYIQGALEKIPLLLKTGLFNNQQFHLIGHLQSNKIKKALSVFYSIDSIDSINLAKDIAFSLPEEKQPYPIMLEVKTSLDESKFGFSEDRLMDQFGELLLLKKLNIYGLMTIGTLDGTPMETKRCFALLRTIKEKLEDTYHYKIPILSMGMSEDYSIAIEEGSNMLRIGRAIFGGL